MADVSTTESRAQSNHDAARARAALVVVGGLTLAALGVVCVAFEAPFVMSLIGCLVAAAVFLFPLRSSLGASGLAALSLTVFGFFPSLYLWVVEANSVSTSIWPVSALYGALIVVSVGHFSRRQTLAASTMPRGGDAADIRGKERRALHLALMISALGFSLVPGYRGIFGYVCVALIAVSARWARSKRASLMWIIGALVGLWAFSEFVFAEFGRLILVSLAIAVFLSLQALLPIRFLKPSVLAALPASLAYLASRRAAFHSARVGSGDETGFESVLSPFQIFSRLLDMVVSGQVDVRYGHTFGAVLSAPVPRALWPDKPVGLGVELAEIFAPEYVDAGQTMWALLFGEFYFNFGLAGLFLAIAVLFFVSQRLDDWLLRVESRRSAFVASAGSFVVVVFLTAGLPDLIWGGMQVFVTRSGFRVLAFAGIWLLAKTVLRTAETSASVLRQ